jgi:hypothetical protein
VDVLGATTAAAGGDVVLVTGGPQTAVVSLDPVGLVPLSLPAPWQLTAPLGLDPTGTTATILASDGAGSSSVLFWDLVGGTVETACSSPSSVDLAPLVDPTGTALRCRDAVAGPRLLIAGVPVATFDDAPDATGVSGHGTLVRWSVVPLPVHPQLRAVGGGWVDALVHDPTSPVRPGRAVFLGGTDHLAFELWDTVAVPVDGGTGLEPDPTSMRYALGP